MQVLFRTFLLVFVAAFAASFFLYANNDEQPQQAEKQGGTAVRTLVTEDVWRHLVVDFEQQETALSTKTHPIIAAKEDEESEVELVRMVSQQQQQQYGTSSQEEKYGIVYFADEEASEEAKAVQVEDEKNEAIIEQIFQNNIGLFQFDDDDERDGNNVENDADATMLYRRKNVPPLRKRIRTGRTTDVNPRFISRHDDPAAFDPRFVSRHDDPDFAATASTVVNDEEGLVVPSSASLITNADAVITTKNSVTPTVVNGSKNPIHNATNLTLLLSSFDHVRSLDELENASSAACDESLCIGRGLASTFNYSITCYSDSSSGYLSMCVNGYIPQIIEEESIRVINDDNGPSATNEWNYFTCCPRNVSSYVNVTRHCSDPIIRNKDSNNTAAAICIDNTSQPHLRQMKASAYFLSQDDVSFVCCDSTMATTTTFSNTTECLPYADANYKRGWKNGNTYGFIFPHFCNHSDTGYIYSKYTAGDLYYECCNSDQHAGPFIVDSAFKGTVYPQIILSFLASMFCTILILALLVPLLKHLRQQYSRTTGTSTNITSTSTRTEFSSYNLYLIYLAFPDLILNLYLFGMYSSYAMQILNPDFAGRIIIIGVNKGWLIEGAFIISASSANLYLNCVISYELFVLLRNNERIVRHKPPTFQRVSLQAVGVYLFSVIIFCINYFVLYKIFGCHSQAECPKQQQHRLTNGNLFLNIVVTYILPISFFLFVWITIKCRNYLPSITGKWKEVVLFFFRIILVFCLIWLPGMFLINIGTNSLGSINHYKFYQIGLLFCSIQPIISTIVAMTKTDVRQYTYQLLTLSCIFRNNRSLVNV